MKESVQSHSVDFLGQRKKENPLLCADKDKPYNLSLNMAERTSSLSLEGWNVLGSFLPMATDLDKVDSDDAPHLPTNESEVKTSKEDARAVKVNPNDRKKYIRYHLRN